MILTDEEVRARIGGPTKGKLMVVLEEGIFRPNEDGRWERYPEADEGAPAELDRPATA